jgi:hypothetical protein
MIDNERSTNRLLLSECSKITLECPRSLQKARRFPALPCLSWVLMILVLFSPLVTRAQEVAGTLNGVVTDSSGAIIPHATVTITLDGVSAAEHVVQADADGNYTATNLTPGTYTVTVAVSGFETFTAKGVTLFVGQKRTVNAQLKAGAASQTVTVEENPVSIDTASSAQEGTITGTQVRELELVNRNFQSLLALQPGVNSSLGDEPGFGINNGTAVSVNGARTTSNNWMVDGADINDSGSNGTLLNVPGIDAIQEFTLARGSYDASFGRSGGGQVMVATKSGTSQYHGDAFEFVRNTDTDANTYFGKQAGDPTPIDHYNNFGFTLGGPLYIPKLYNKEKKKTFFFWSEEWRKVSTPAVNSMPAATSAELGGVVPGQYTPPASESSCATFNASANTTTINPSCYSQNSQVYLTNIFDKFPANNSTNYVSTYSSLNNFRQDLVRVDHYFSDRVHFYARGMEDDVPENLPTGLWGGANFPGLVNASLNAPGKNVVANLTWTISPRLVNEVEFAYSQGTINVSLSGVANSPSFNSALTNNTAYTDPYGRIPSVFVAGGSFTELAQGSAPYDERNLDRNIFDHFSATLGKHTLRAGFTVQQMLKTENASAGNAAFYFDTWADFLLGNVEQYTQASHDTIPDLRFYNTEAYVQDDWKLNQKLTINLGLRWTRFPSPTDAKNTLNNFDPLVYNPANAPVLDSSGNFVAGQAYTPATYTNGLIFPKGAACAAAQAISAQVTCSPYGSTVNPNHNLNFGPRVGFAYNPDGRGLTAIRGGFGIFYDRTLDGIWEQNAFGDPPLVQTTNKLNTAFDQPLGGVSSVSLTPNGLTATGTPTFKVPSYADYNLSLQQQLQPSTILEVAYVGAVARHLMGEEDLNQPTLAARIANPTLYVNSIRPYLGYSDFHTRFPGFNNTYNSLQVQLTHRTTHGLTLGVAYTWSKDLSVQTNDRGVANSDAYNPKLDYGTTSNNTPQMFAANYVYQLPFYQGQHGLVGKTLGGWELSGVTLFDSGSSQTVTQAIGATGGSADPFACIASTATSNGCVAGTYPGGLGISQPNGDILARPDQSGPVHLTKTQAQWFTTSPYSYAVGHFGTGSIGNFLGPGSEKWNLALMKNIELGERWKLQLRAESFNVFNHTNFNAIDTGLGDGAFGRATGAANPRAMQFGGKLYF